MTLPPFRVPSLVFAGLLFAACSSSSAETGRSLDSGTGDSSRGVDSGDSHDSGDPAAAALCTKSGGHVVETYCSANPPFAQYTCATGENGAICDPGPDSSAATPECVCPTGECFDPTHGCTSRGDDGGSSDAGTVTAVVGDTCTPGVTSASNQPANPCAAGYIWGCDNATGLWIKEPIVCYADSKESKETTTECGAGQVLFVDDAAGDHCEAGSGEGSSNTVCPSGTYEFEPGCCYGATDAYCVPLPASCHGSLSVACAKSICVDQCNGGTTSDDASELTVSGAAAGVADCLCDKG